MMRGSAAVGVRARAAPRSEANGAARPVRRGQQRRVGILALVAAAACARPEPVAPSAPLPRALTAHYLAGKLAGYQGDWDAAIDQLAAAAAAAPDQPMVAVELARAQHKARRAADALATLAAARTRWPTHPEVWQLSGDLLASGDPGAATAAYLRAIQLAPDHEHGYLGLARLQPPAAAEATLRILVDHVPASVEGHYRLAVRLATRGELAAATGELRAVLELDPDHIDARIDLARALRRQGRLAAAIAEARGAFDRSGQAIDLGEELFWLLCEADDRTAAIDLLTLLDDDRSDADALAVVARIERGLGRIQEARAIIDRIAAIDRDAGALALAELQLALGDRAAVQATLAPVAQDGKLAEPARRLRAEAARAAGDPTAALATLGVALAASAAWPGGRAPRAARLAIDSALVAAYALADLGRLAEAQALLAGQAGAAATAAERASAGLAQARLAEHAGDPAAAVVLLEAVLRDAPDRVAALNLAGYLLTETRRRLGDAGRYLARARELAPGDPEVLDSWGWWLLHTGKPRDAVRALDRAARFAPLEPEILVHLAAAWAADGAPRTAAGVLDRATSLAPSPAVQRRIAAVRASVVTR
jgi:cellulose synthase operon protein C